MDAVLLELYGRQRNERIFRGEALYMIVKAFQTNSVHIFEGVKVHNRSRQNAWILPAAFDPLPYIKDSSIWKSVELEAAAKSNQ